jgi:hypothetical protein
LLAVAGFVVGCAQGSGPRLTADAGIEDGMVDGKPSPVDASAPDGCVAQTEICNGKDDDCDGASDEDLGLGMPCDGADSDGCKEGMVVCDGAGGTTCDDMTTDTVEICNGVDDDCQNGADDTFPVGQACSVGIGACATTGMRVCDTAMTGTTCTAMSGAPTSETCGNNIDEDCTGADTTCPGNDMPAGAINISAGGTWNVDVSTSHDDNYAPSTATMPCGNMGGRDAFFQFSLPSEEVVYYDTYGSNYDTVVRIFAGSCTSLGPTLVCSDDSCNGTRSIGAVDLTAGTYCLVVDQFSSNTTGGMTTLTFRRGGRPGLPLPAASGTVTGTTTGKANLSVASCESNTNQPDVGHFFLSCPGFTYTVDASTCTGTTFDSVLYIRTGTATSADVACSDDVSGCGTNNLQSKITGAAVVGGNLHWIIVDGWGSSGNGSYSLTYSIQ